MPPRMRALRQQVLRRDGWRCQACGRMSNLEVHHKQFRSRLGDDSDANLITLCTVCHAGAHHGSFMIVFVITLIGTCTFLTRSMMCANNMARNPKHTVYFDSWRHISERRYFGLHNSSTF
jgi:HNH endonuclease